MKKIMLSIAEPCHEKWDNMMPEEKGRFCASCQKTVVDFTGMSDRQIADYFQKPAGLICGRFYNDQLNRPITLPGKKLTLPKHFFRYTWPAFLLLLKSCDEREELVGELDVTITEPGHHLPVMGMILPQITPVDSSQVLFHKPVAVDCKETEEPRRSELLGDTTLLVQPNESNDLSLPVDSSFVLIDSAVIDIDHLKITTGAGKNEILMGAVAVSTCTSPTQQKVDPEVNIPLQKEKPQVVVYPNPLPKGQALQVRVKQAFTGVYQVWAITGQVLQTGKIAVVKEQPLTIAVQGLPSGTYVLRLADAASKTSITEKFIVQ